MATMNPYGVIDIHIRTYVLLLHDCPERDRFDPGDEFSNSSDEPSNSRRNSGLRLPRGAAVFVSATVRSGFADDFESDGKSDSPE